MTAPVLPLPRYDTLPEGVYFHRRFKGDVHVFILQVPDEDRVDSETHIVDLNKTIHRAWVEGLKNSRNLLTTLQWAEHVAFCPRTGHFEEMPDLDAVSEVAQTVALARKEAAFDRNSGYLRSRHRRQSKDWGPSPLRRALSGERGRGRIR